jgi:hypothetical protein
MIGLAEQIRQAIAAINSWPVWMRNAAADMTGKCRACNGNDRDVPCAYPSEGQAGCLRDVRLGRTLPSGNTGGSER